METETLEQTANEALKQIIEKATEAGNWELGEIPEVVEQLLLWHMVESLIFFTASILLLLIGVIGGTFFLRKGIRNGCEVFITIGLFFAVFLIPVGLITTSCNLEWIQILIAPKLYLIEYAANLLK